MKKYILLFFVAYITNFGFAQAPPQGINYQAVVYSDNGDNQPGLNVSGQVLRNKNIRVRYTIIQNASNGTEVYKEAHTTTTDAFGMFSLIIGQGVQEGSNAFASISWGAGKHFLKVEIDKRGGTNYVMMSNQQLLSVPYALYADKSTYSTTSGNGIVSVTDNGNGTLTFTYFDGSTYTSPVLTGLQGPQGVAGLQGPAGQNGANGNNGQNGLSAYEIWLSQGNTGTEQDFLTSLTGAQGIQGVAGQNGSNGSNGSNGTNGKNTLVKTTTESVGSNCTSGGVKIEYGLDANSNGVLDVSEVNASLTKYVCNCVTGAQGNTGYSNSLPYPMAGGVAPNNTAYLTYPGVTNNNTLTINATSQRLYAIPFQAALGFTLSSFKFIPASNVGSSFSLGIYSSVVINGELSPGNLLYTITSNGTTTSPQTIINNLNFQFNSGQSFQNIYFWGIIPSSTFSIIGYDKLPSILNNAIGAGAGNPRNMLTYDIGSSTLPTYVGYSSNASAEVEPFVFQWRYQ
ncbi:MAG: hypothetical protein EBQ94_12980 [Flavobacteriales bacterium]|nr:hypothetical protein [Flavobacteriales bacterium]